MTTFDEREAAFEAKFAHDEAMQFRAQARCNKLLGLWAAEMMGKTGTSAEEYALSVVRADFEEPGIEDVVRKITADLEGRVPSDEIRSKYADLMPEARAQVMGEAEAEE